MFKGQTINWLIDYEPDYLTYMRKRRHIRLSREAATRLSWKLSGDLPPTPKKNDAPPLTDADNNRLTHPT